MNTLEKVPLSVVIVALNEEANIARVIKSAQWANEVLIYDSGSGDSTRVIAEKMGAKVISGEWLGFGPTKKKASQLASYDWVLSLDADEEVSSALRQEISSKISSGLRQDVAYRIPRISFYLNRWIKHGGWYPDRQVRLFNRKHSMWTEDVIHERVQASSYVNLSSNLNHYVFRDIEHQVSTNNRYSSLQAQKMYSSGTKFSWFHFFTKPYVKFIECYFLKLGILDGWGGYFIARSAAYSVFLKWSKLYELEQKLSNAQNFSEMREIAGVK